MFVYNICLFTSHLKKTQTKKSQEQGIIPTTKNIPKKERITQTTEFKKKISIEKLEGCNCTLWLSVYWAIIYLDYSIIDNITFISG